MLAITFIAAVACILLVVIGCDLPDHAFGTGIAAIGAAGLMLLILILHAARVGWMVLS